MIKDLAQKLIAMAEEDQRVLQRLFESGELPAEYYHPEMKALHERNTTALKDIIKDYGWPVISLVGNKGADSAWLIVQHAVSDQAFMTECVALMKQSVDDIEGWQLAFLQDRVLTMSGKDQYYGTQFDKDDEGWPKPFPIADPDSVNERRLALGLNTLEARFEQMVEREKNRRLHQQELR